MQQLEASIRALERDVRFVDWRLKGGRLAEAHGLLPEYGKVDIVLARHESRLVFGPRSGPPDYISTAVSPVLECAPPRFNGDILRAGRLYYPTSCYAENGELTDMPNDFLQFAQRAVRSARRLFKRSPIFASGVGRAASAWIERVNAKQIPVATLVPGDHPATTADAAAGS